MHVRLRTRNRTDFLKEDEGPPATRARHCEFEAGRRHAGVRHASPDGHSAVTRGSKSRPPARGRMEPEPAATRRGSACSTLNAHQGLRAAHRHGVLLRIRKCLARLAGGPRLPSGNRCGYGSGAARASVRGTCGRRWTQHAYGRNAVETGGHHGNARLSRDSVTSWRKVDASVGQAEPRGLSTQ